MRLVALMLLVVAYAPAQQDAPEVLEVEVVGAELTLFPTATQPARFVVRARKLVADPGSLRCRVVLDSLAGAADPGYAASPEITLELTEQGVWYEAPFAVSFTRDPPPMTTGKLVVTGRVGERSVRRDVPLRAGRDALAFLERRQVPFPDGPRRVDIQCLENRYLRAEIIPAAGVLSGLFSPRARRDALVPGDHPVGFLWAGVGEWFHKTSPRPGEHVRAELRANHGGHAILMQASLGHADETLVIDLDAGALPQTPGPLYLMTTASATGGDVARLPLVGGVSEVSPAAEPQRVAASALAQHRVALYLAGLDETLELSFSGPALTALDIGAQGPWYNYVAFHLEGPPGRMRFRFSLREGG